MDLSRGGIIKGYDLINLIGEGAYGAVYRARQSQVEREVAIKIILPQYANQADFIRRFESEAQLIAQLEHMHIVPLYDYWRDAEGAYLVMRLMKGGSLADSLKAGEPWEISGIARLVDQVASALDTAHKKGIIHRDLKPANILLDEDGNAYLSDFGIAKVVGVFPGQTATGAIVGTPAYISPEQAQSRQVSPQTDIYALGVMLYEILAGVHPFPETPTAALIFKHVNQPLPLICDIRPELPAEIDQVIQKATCKDPAERYADALALAADFRRALSPQLAVQHIPESEIYNPYKGLRAFQEADAADFFGREGLTSQLLARLDEEEAYSRFLTVVGPSGSGKSSAVRAGLLPVIRQGALPGSDNWFIASMIPGPHPLEELEIALLRMAANPNLELFNQLKRDGRGLIRAARLILPDEDDQLLLFVDQFEELFTLVENPREARQFMDLIHQAVTEKDGRVRVVVTLRADFYDRPLMHPDFGGLVQGRTEVVLPLTSEELQEAVRCPAERIGVAFEGGLVTDIVADVIDQPGSLPVLQYALTELFERRRGRIINQNAYQEIGGVLGALGRRSEEIFQGLEEEAKAITRQVFLRLVTLGEGVEDTRRRVLQAELEALTSRNKSGTGSHSPLPQVGEASPVNTVSRGTGLSREQPAPGGTDRGSEREVREVLDSFGHVRLLSFDHDPLTRSPTVEVAHEALLREWSRLRDWLDESRADIRNQRVLCRAANDWLAAEKDPSFLLRGSRLDQFAAWKETTDLALTQIEEDYLEASLAERYAREAAEAKRNKHEADLERRSRNFLRGLVAVLGIAALVAGALSIFALNQQGVAERNAATATVAQGQAQIEAATAVAAQQEAQTQTGRAEQAAAEAQDQKAIADQETRAALEAYSLSLAANAQQALDNKDPVTALALALAANRIDDPPLESQRVLMEAAYAPGPRYRFLVGDTFELASWEPCSIDISPDGHTALVGTNRGPLVWWDLETTAKIEQFNLPDHSDVNEVQFTQDGKTVLSASDNGFLYHWNLSTAEEINRFQGHSWYVLSLDISPDESYAASISEHEIIVWDMETGREVHRFDLSQYAPSSDQLSAETGIKFNPDGHTLVGSYSTSLDINLFNLMGCSVRADQISGESHLGIWDVETGKLINHFPGRSSAIWDIALSPDGRTALTGSDRGQVELWDLESGEVIHTFEGHKQQVLKVAISPDGRWGLSGSHEDGSLILWDLTNQKLSAKLNAHTSDITDIAFSPDGRTALSSSLDGTLILWDLVPEYEINRLFSNSSAIPDLKITPDGRYLLSSNGLTDEPSTEEGYTLQIWDAKNGDLLSTLRGHTDSILEIDISPDGKFALTASADRSVKLWDLESRKEVRSFLGHNNWVTDVAFSPDGSQFVSSSRDRTLILWDITTGEKIQTIIGDQLRMNGVDYSPDGRTIISAGEDGVFLWDTETGFIIRVMQDSAEADGVTFSPDGSSAISISESQGVNLWDVASGVRIRQFVGIDEIINVDISPDSRTALLGTENGMIILWDLQTGDVLRRFNGHNGETVGGVAFSPDGSTAFSGGGNDYIIQWRLDTPPLDKLLEWIDNNRYVRELTCAERELYSIEPLCE